MEDIFQLALKGDLDGVALILAKAERLKLNIVDRVDDSGRTACFHAQLLGHTDVVALLAKHGWTTMDQSNLFRAANGRLCFWQEPKLPRGRRLMPVPMRPAPASAASATPASTKLRMVSSKKAAMRERKEAREKSARNNAVAAAKVRTGVLPCSVPCPHTLATNKRLPALDASDLLELVAHRAFECSKRRLLASGTRLRTGAGSLLKQSWAAATLSLERGDDGHADELEDLVAASPEARDVLAAHGRPVATDGDSSDDSDWERLELADAAGWQLSNPLLHRMRRFWA